MKISKKDLKKIIKEEIEATLTEEFGDDAPFRARDMVPPKVRGKFKDTFTKIPNPDLEKRSAERRPDAQEKAAWKAAGGALSVFDKPAIAQFLEDADLNISLEKYMDNISWLLKTIVWGAESSLSSMHWRWLTRLVLAAATLRPPRRNPAGHHNLQENL